MLAYEPRVVTLAGKIHQGRFQHPNGEWVRFQYVKLDAPINMKADSNNPVNIEERDVIEVQIYSDKAAIRKALNASVGSKVVLKGTIFHEHTAWHNRKLIMDVSAVNASAPNHTTSSNAPKRAG
jgi:hypothetical protein